MAVTRKRGRTAAQKAASRKNLEAARKKRQKASAGNAALGLTRRGRWKRTGYQRQWGAEDGAAGHDYGGKAGRVFRAKKDPKAALERHEKKRQKAKNKSVAARKARARKAVATRRRRKK